MKKNMAIILMILFCVCFVVALLGIHRNSNIYQREDILLDEDYQMNDYDNSEHTMQSENQEAAIQEEDHYSRLYLNLKTNQLKQSLENLGYSTKIIENGDNDFFQSISSGKMITVSYNMNDDIAGIEVKYKYDMDLSTIEEDNPLVNLWGTISELVNKEEYRTEFLDFVKNYKELNGKSCKIGNVSIYSQVYGDEFYINIERVYDNVE